MANTIKTKRIIAPTEGTISFHRITSVEVYCDGQEAGTYEVDPNADVPDTWREVQLATKDASVILDTSSFVVELVNLTDNTVITLDSVCIMPNPGHMMPATGTTDATSVMFNVAIPPSCWGDTVYVRAVPYRWGPTPFGMTSSMTRSDISLSTLYKQMPTDLLSLSRLYNHTAFYDTLDNWRLNDLIMYMGSDTVRQCTPVVFWRHLPSRYVDADFRIILGRQGLLQQLLRLFRRISQRLTFDWPNVRPTGYIIRKGCSIQQYVISEECKQPA